MRHYKKGRKLGTDTSHTKAMKKSLVCALLANDRIKTIDSRAKEIRPDVDKIITWAKRGDLHSRRLAIAALGDKELVREIFEKVAQGMFQDRQGGYTRIMKLGPRKGDDAPMVIMELVTEPVKAKKDEAKPAAKKAAKKAAPKKVEKADDEAKAEETKVEAEEAQSCRPGRGSRRRERGGRRGRGCGEGEGRVAFPQPAHKHVFEREPTGSRFACGGAWASAATNASRTRFPAVARRFRALDYHRGSGHATRPAGNPQQGKRLLWKTVEPQTGNRQPTAR